MPYIYVLGMDGKPQMPTTRRRHVQRLLDTGRARIVSLPEWGLIEVSEGEENVYNYVAEVTIPAKKNQGVLRDRTLSTALIRFSML